MTLHLLDVASYQGNLAPTDVARAGSGFGAVNLKISHGLTRKAVHPNITGWVDAARASGWGISTFHFMTADASGADQARYAYARLTELGLLYGTCHQLDVESDPAPSLANVRAYLTAMTELLGRPVAVYTGDWWWKPRGWDVSDLSPYLWAAPNDGYLSGYPGDRATAWSAGYGGWPQLSIMQYAVGPLVFPDGSKGHIDVSKSAIRDGGVWRDLTLGRPGMSTAPGTLKDARTYYIDTLTRIAGYRIDPLSVGIVGDDSHANAGTSYHLGKDALKSTAYSIVESPRDRNGLTNAAAALDLGWFSFKVGTVTHNLRTFSAWLVKQCQANTPDTRDIREVIYSLDGQTVKRWDRLGLRTTGDDSHLSHTHESWFRDSEGRDKTAHLRRYFTEIGLLEGDDMTPAEMTEWAKSAAGKAAIWAATFGQDQIQGYDANGVPLPENPADPYANTMTPATAAAFAARFERVAMPKINALGVAVGNLSTAVAGIAKNVVADDGDLAAIQASITAASAATADAVIAELAASGRSDEDVAAALRAALGDRAAAIGALLR